jgi:hypothetical protein
MDLFKESICKTLEECSDNIEAARGNMEELGDNAQLIIEEIDDMENRGYSLSSQQQCEYCDTQLFDSQHHFYLFPCSHGFCADCLSERAEDVLLGNLCICICIRILVYAYMYALFIYTYVYILMNIHNNMGIFTHIYLQTYVYMHVHIHSHTSMCAFLVGDLDKLKYVRSLEEKICSLGVRAHHNHGADKRAVTQVNIYMYIYMYIYIYI